jgi:alpha-methylacyl-CoA racemase
MEPPLSGVRIIELAGIGPAQHGAMLLADLGADVVRVDRPSAAGTPGGVLDRGRRSIALDLKDADGLETARALIAEADVLIDPYRPGVLERLGLDPAGLHSRLIVARMTGWGQDGPLAQAAGHDINYVALTGALEAMGPPDAVPPVPLNVVGDFGGGGMLLAYGIVVALFERSRSGRGQVVDVAMVDGVASLLAGVLHLRGLGQWNPERGTNWLQGAAPWYRAYRTADGGFITVGSLEAKFYALLLQRLGLDAERWPQWDTERWPALAAELTAIFATRTLDGWREELEGTDACFAPALRLEDAARHPHLVARGTYFTREDGTLEPAVVPRLSRTPGAVPAAAPRVDEHRDEILGELPAG